MSLNSHMVVYYEYFINGMFINLYSSWQGAEGRLSDTVSKNHYSFQLSYGPYNQILCSIIPENLFDAENGLVWGQVSIVLTM